jgi:hypothetical protein
VSRMEPVLNNTAIRLCLGGGLGYIMIHPRFVKLT